MTREIPQSGLAMLRKRKGVVVDIYGKDRVIKQRELLRGVRGADAILSILTDKIDADVMDAAGPQLKIIANFAVGFDNIDLKAAKARGITVSNAPTEEVSETVAEHVVALMFALAHRVVETDRFTRKNKYHGWGPQMMLGTDVYKKTVGIVGAGAIGSALARRLRDGFEAKIIYTDIKRSPRLEAESGAAFRTLPQLLKQADFVSLHVPLVPTTRHLISTKQLKAMKPGAFLINTARGPVIDESALIFALQNNLIRGAGLDVYEFEPHISRRLRKLPNVVLTPHTASATIEAREAMSRQAAKNILAYFSGKVPPNALN